MEADRCKTGNVNPVAGIIMHYPNFHLNEMISHFGIFLVGKMLPNVGTQIPLIGV